MKRLCLLAAAALAVAGCSSVLPDEQTAVSQNQEQSAKKGTIKVTVNSGKSRAQIEAVQTKVIFAQISIYSPSGAVETRTWSASYPADTLSFTANGLGQYSVGVVEIDEYGDSTYSSMPFSVVAGSNTQLKITIGGKLTVDVETPDSTVIDTTWHDTLWNDSIVGSLVDSNWNMYYDSCGSDGHMVYGDGEIVAKMLCTKERIPGEPVYVEIAPQTRMSLKKAKAVSITYRTNIRGFVRFTEYNSYQVFTAELPYTGKKINTIEIPLEEFTCDNPTFGLQTSLPWMFSIVHSTPELMMNLRVTDVHLIYK